VNMMSRHHRAVLEMGDDVPSLDMMLTMCSL